MPGAPPLRSAKLRHPLEIDPTGRTPTFFPNSLPHTPPREIHRPRGHLHRPTCLADKHVSVPGIARATPVLRRRGFATPAIAPCSSRPPSRPIMRPRAMPEQLRSFGYRTLLEPATGPRAARL